MIGIIFESRTVCKQEYSRSVVAQPGSIQSASHTERQPTCDNHYSILHFLALSECSDPLLLFRPNQEWLQIERKRILSFALWVRHFEMRSSHSRKVDTFSIIVTLQYHTFRNILQHLEFSFHNFVRIHKWDSPTQHFIQKNPQTPNSCGARFVRTGIFMPLRWHTKFCS